MNPQHLRALRDHRRQLVHGTNSEHIPTILDYLVQDNIITEQDEQQVQEKDGPNQVRKLLAILPSKGDRAFQSFCQALEETGHGGLVRKLTKDLNSKKGENPTFTAGHVHEAQPLLGPCDQDTDDLQTVSIAAKMQGMISILLVNDGYGTSQGGVSTINRQLAQFLASQHLNVYCIVLKASDKDKEDAERDHVTLLFPERFNDDNREPSLPWLFDHASRFPHLPSDISCVIGHRDVTSDAALLIKEERYPQAKLFLFNHDMPEDTDHYKDEGKVLEIQGKKEAARKDAEKADALFSVGPYMHDYYCNMYRALQDPLKSHIKFVPKPSDVFIETNPIYIETQTKVVLSIGKVSGVERLKGYDLAAMALNMVAEIFPHMKWQQRGISRDAFYESKKIINSRIDVGTFRFTPLEYGTQEQICEDIKQAHLVLVPSRTEPFGLIGLEAIAAGIPVLVSDRSGLALFLRTLGPEFDHCIFRIQGNDTEDSKNLAKRITEMLQNGRKEFEFSRQLKDKLLASKYWEESQRALCQECGVHMEADITGTSCQQKTGTTFSVSHPKGDTSNGHSTPSSLEQNPTHSHPGPSRPLLKASSDQISVHTRQTRNNRSNISPASPSELLNMNIDAAIECVVASIISDEWRTLLHHLGLSEQELETLQNKETPEVACEAGMKLWRETCGQEVTIERLVKAVKDTKIKLRNGADVKVKLSIKEKWSDWLNKKADIIFTEEVLNDPQRFDMAMHRFDKLKGSIKDLWEGSVWCLLTFYRWSSVQEFVDGCREGALTELLTHEYVDEQMTAACGGTELYVCVEIDQTDLHNAWNFFHEDCQSPDEDHPPSDDLQTETLSSAPSSSLEGEPMDIDTHISVKEEPMDLESDLDTAFEIVSKDLWSDWERLAHAMGFTQSDVDSIKSASPDQPYEQCWKLLYRWRDREGQKATLQALIQQLRVAGFHDSAGKLNVADMSDQDEHGASKKTSDDSEASSDSDSDSDGDDDSAKGAATSKLLKMKPLKMGKRRVPDPQRTAGKGVKKKKMTEEDSDVEMVEETGVSRSDNTEQAEVATDDLSFKLTPDDIKRWQEAMKTHVVPDRIASLEEQFRFNMLVMHLIKDEFYHEHLCHYWNDKGALPFRLTQFVSHVVTKLGHEYCVKDNLDVEAYHSIEEDIQYQFGKLLFKQHAGGVCKLLSLESLQSCFTDDQLKYVQAWLEPTSDDTGSSSVAPYYRFKHECIRQYMMAMWVAGTIHEAGETIRANEFLRQCFDLSSKLDLMAYFVAGLMAQKVQVDLFSYQLSRILFSMDTTDFCVSQKVAICIAETGQVDRFESHTSQIFPGNVIDLTLWPSMSYLGKLALAHLKETFPLTCKISNDAEMHKLLFKSKKNKAEAQSLLSLVKSRHRSVSLYPHYKSLIDSSSALVSQTPCHMDKLYLNNLALNDCSDLKSILSLLQFVPALKHLSLQKTTLSPSGISTICDFLSFIPSIEHLVLSKCRISNDSIATLGEHFHCLQKLKHLNLSQTGITSEGANIVSHCLSSLTELEVVDLTKNKVGKDELTNLCESITGVDKIPKLILGSQTSSYKILLGINSSRGSRLIVKTGDTDVVTLVSQLSSHVYKVELSCQGKVLYSVQIEEGENPHRMTLDLTCAGDITKNIRALAAVLPVGHCVQQADVEELKLGGSDIGNEEVRLLAEMLCYLPRLKHLDLSDNIITPLGARTVASHMPHLQQLEWLDLSDIYIGEDGATAMNEMLPQLEKLKCLNLTTYGVSVDMRKSLFLTLSKMEHLSEVNLRSKMFCKYVYLLGVNNNQGHKLTIKTDSESDVSVVDQVLSQVYRVELSCQGKVLYSVQTEEGENPHRMTLDLTCAGDITENIWALAAVLPVGHRVQQADVEELRLGGSDIGDEEVRLLAEMFCYLPRLKHLDLSFCGITSTVATVVASHMSHLQQLEWLDLSGIYIGDEGTTAMNEMLPQLEKLKCLNLTTFDVSVDMRKSLLLTLSKMEHLSEVNLSSKIFCSYMYLLGVYNNQGHKLTIRMGDSESDVVSLVDEVFSQVYRVQLSHQGNMLYSVQTEENPHRMTLDLTCAGEITQNIRALAVVLPVGHRVQQADVEELRLGGSRIGDEEPCQLDIVCSTQMWRNLI
ncbi:uncharacterized protein LOC144910389 isoform X2 [Branchiostoma floridae x Branchiostoma belcheri]